MPFAYPNPARIRQILLERIGAGEKLTKVCGRDGLPTIAAIRLWRRADPEFDAVLTAAMEGARWRKRFAFDPAKAKAIIQRRQAGEALAAILREPGMPSRRVFRHWVEGDLDLAEAMVRVRQARREERVGRCQGRRRAFDPVLADRIYARVAMGGVLERVLRADPALPSRPVFARWRREAPDFDRRFRQMLRHIHRHRCRHRLFQPALVAEIANRVRMGATLARIGREPGMPCSTTLYAWRRRHPGFAEALAEAREDRLDVLRDEMLAILEAETPATRAAGRRRIANLGQRLDRLSRRLAEGRGG